MTDIPGLAAVEQLFHSVSQSSIDFSGLVSAYGSLSVLGASAKEHGGFLVSFSAPPEKPPFHHGEWPPVLSVVGWHSTWNPDHPFPDDLLFAPTFSVYICEDLKHDLLHIGWLHNLSVSHRVSVASAVATGHNLLCPALLEKPMGDMVQTEFWDAAQIVLSDRLDSLAADVYAACLAVPEEARYAELVRGRRQDAILALGKSLADALSLLSHEEVRDLVDKSLVEQVLKS